MQEARISMLNRVRDIIRKKNEDIPFDEVEEEKDPEERDFDSKYDDENLGDLVEEMFEKDKLTDREYQYILDLLEATSMTSNAEEKYRNIMAVVENEPIYTEWLDNVYGVSTTLTARLLHRFNYCEDYEKVSNLWSYCGFAPGQVRVKGEQLNHDPQSKTLGWLVADRIIMQGDNSDYKKNFYDPYKEIQENRLERNEEGMCIKCGEMSQTDTFSVNHWECKDCGNDGYGDTSAKRHMDITSEISSSHVITFGDESKSIEVDLCPSCAERLIKNGERLPTAPKYQGHAHNRAVRYLAKKFLKHYWAIARDIKGHETPDEWILTHGGHEKREDTFENPFYAKRQLRSIQS